VPLPYQPENNDIPGHTPPSVALDALRTLALSRTYLDNVDHITACWVGMGLKLAQVALKLGADDLHGTIFEEHIFHMAGATSPQLQTEAEMIRWSGLTSTVTRFKEGLGKDISEARRLGSTQPTKLHHRRRSTGRVEFLEDVFEMMADRKRADAQSRRRFVVGPPLLHLEQDFDFPPAQSAHRCSLRHRRKRLQSQHQNACRTGPSRIQ
jgi:hypothetical protein